MLGNSSPFGLRLLAPGRNIFRGLESGDPDTVTGLSFRGMSLPLEVTPPEQWCTDCKTTCYIRVGSSAAHMFLVDDSEL